MIAEATPSVEEQRPLAFALLISKVHVVEPPGWRHAGHLGVRFLLPIEPPEINALLLEGMKNKIEEVGCEFLVRDVERNVLPGRSVATHVFALRAPLSFPRFNTRPA